MNVPLVAWHVHCFLSKNLILDPTSIFSNLNNAKKQSYFKMGFYIVAFFYFLYRLIYTLVREVVTLKEANTLFNKFTY